MLGSLGVHNDLSIIRYEPYHGFYNDNKRLTMNKEQTIVDLLIELDKMLKVETHEDAYPYFCTNDPEDKILRAKYAGRIYGARRLLGLSLEAQPGALLPSEPVDEFSELVNKSKSSGNNDH